LVGQAGGAVTASIQQVKLATSGTFIAAGNTVTFIGTAASSVTAQLQGSVGWANGTDQLCVIPFSNSQTTLNTPDGGSTTYWLLVTAVTTIGNKLVLGAGNIIATDSGQGKGVLTNNLVPGAAAYSVGGSYTLTGLTPGFVYFWKMGANDTGCGPLTATGSFMATTSSVVLTGTASLPVTAVVYATNQYPYYTTVAIINGAPSFSVSGLSLPFTPLGAEATVMRPNPAAVSLQADADYSSLSASGVTFYLQTNAPATGYIALVKIY
jgi:hypothetical protein